MNKKAISTIVATVLIILITVAAVAIIWAAIIPMIKNQLSGSTTCLDAVSQITILNEGYTCKNTDGSISIQIKRDQKDFTLADLQLLFHTGGETTKVTLVKDELYAKTDLPGTNQARVYLIGSEEGALRDSIADADKVEVAPVVGIGSSEETCGIAANLVLRDCATPAE